MLIRSGLFLRAAKYAPHNIYQLGNEQKYNDVRMIFHQASKLLRSHLYRAKVIKNKVPNHHYT